MSLAASDLFLSPKLTKEQAQQYLKDVGFRDPAAADEHLQAIAVDQPVREAMGALADRLFDALRRAPDPDAALVGFSRYAASRYPRTAFLHYLRDDPGALAVLIEVMGTSPFLTEILIRNPEYLDWLAAETHRNAPEAQHLRDEARGLVDLADAVIDRVDSLKRFKRREILRIASGDILGHETLESATRQLSDLADVITEQVLRIATRLVIEAAAIPRLPGRFAVIGLGKLGGSELNYSSDVDLLFVYEPDDEDDQRQHQLFQKLGRKVIALLTEFTDEGYLYRVDLRLRPMGRRGNVAYSLKQHAQYYDMWGETFERFALIKARPIAGDRGVGDRFVDLVQPFVYRRYLDHAALEEMFRYRARGKPSPGEADHDVKSGRGGIREVELCTQVLQLTYGGRDRSLRESNTLKALNVLERAGLIVKEVRQNLAHAYLFLRRVEHRLQIVHEQQIHALARAEQELNICARRLDFADAAALEAELDRQRRRVHEIYRSIFERRRGTSDFRSRQFFRVLVEEASEAEALELVGEYGLPDRAAALDVIRALDHGTALSPSRSMARNVLANLLSPLLERIARSVRPEQVLMRLEQLTARTGAAGSFYRTLLEHAALRDLLISTLDLGELPAGRLIRYPELLDSLLYTLPDLQQLRTRYQSTLEGFAPGSKGRDQIRRFKAIEEFKILVDWVADRSLATLQERLSVLADCSVARAAAWNAPDPAAAEWAILALGKLGGQELTVHSDLDLVIVYRGDPGDSRTFLVFQNFVEQMVRSLEEPTSEGMAYHVDTRLRPEGRKGALAMPLEVFQKYLETRAEIWERLAWTRYRFLTGSRALAQDVNAAVQAFVYAPWDPRIPRYMTAVRRRMERQLGDPSGQKLEFKIGRGALADIDFLLQMIQIREGHRSLEFRAPGTRQLLEQLSLTSLLTATEIDELRRAHVFLRSLEVFARLEADANVSAVPSDPRRLEPIGRQLQMAKPAGKNLLGTYRRTTGRVRAIYRTVTGRL